MADGMVGRVQYLLGIDADIEPVHAPVQVRTAGAATGPDWHDHLALLDALADLRV